MTDFARVKIPDTLPQLIPVDRKTKKSATGKDQYFIWLEDLIAANLSSLFPGMEIVDSHPFHVTRDADIEIQELEAGDLLETTEEGLRQRRFGDVVRLRVGVGMPSLHVQDPAEQPGSGPQECLPDERPARAQQAEVHLPGIDRPELKDPPFVPAVPHALDPEGEDEDIFCGDTASRRAAAPSVRFVPAGGGFAATKPRTDPDVLAIKMTLYRVGRNSPVVKALLEAMEEGKQVACWWS